MADGTGSGAGSMAEGLDAGLCKGFVESLAISGATISVFSGLSPATMVCASDAVAARIDELQFDLGGKDRAGRPCKPADPCFCRMCAGDLMPRGRSLLNSYWSWRFLPFSFSRSCSVPWTSA